MSYRMRLYLHIPIKLKLSLSISFLGKVIIFFDVKLKIMLQFFKIIIEHYNFKKILP